MKETQLRRFEIYEEFTLRKNIDIFCLFNDLTRTQFAFYCGLEVGTITALNSKRPTDNTYKKISNFTGVPIRILKKLAITKDELVEKNVKENFKNDNE